jgi:hypothetical protein
MPGRRRYNNVNRNTSIVEAERARIREIDAIATIINDPDLVWEAKYGKTACIAKELAERAALNEAVDRGWRLLSNPQNRR